MTTHKVTLDRGPHVVDGLVQWFSATVLTAADERSAGGCQRKHWYLYCDPGRMEAPPTKAQGIGIVTHDHLEHHLRGEEVVLSPLELAMLRVAGDIPKSALIEAPIGELVLAEGANPTRMTCADVPFYGHADVVIPRRSVNEVEVLDWKTTSDIDAWAKTGSELLETVQMISYGEWAARRFGARRIRFTHVYGQTRGAVRAERRSTIADRDEIASGWEYVQTVGRRVVEHAPCESPEDVPANKAACGAYGGCPFRGRCSTGRRTMLMGIMSKMKAGSPAMEKTEADVRAQIAALEAEAEKCRAQMETPQVVPPDAPPSEHPLPEEDKPKKGRGRPKGSKNKPAETAPVSTSDAPPFVGHEEPDDVRDGVPLAKQPSSVPKDSSFLLEVYVDTVQTFPTESLHPYLARICRELCDEYGALDVRAASHDNHLAFGRWKGHLADAIRKNPPAGGSYSLDTRGSEVAEVAADVFRDIAPVYVRGIR